MDLTQLLSDNVATRLEALAALEEAAQGADTSLRKAAEASLKHLIPQV